MRLQLGHRQGRSARKDWDRVPDRIGLVDVRSGGSGPAGVGDPARGRAAEGGRTSRAVQVEEPVAFEASRELDHFAAASALHAASGHREPVAATIHPRP